MKKKPCAIYCRVSTDDQTVENQKRDLLRYCESRELTDVDVFEDVGVSGAQDSRPALDKLMEQVRKHRYSSVLVWKFDRFARSTSHLLQALQEFRDLGVNFISYSEGIDTSTAIGKMVFTFLSAIAEFERSLLQERVRAGMARAKAEGIHCGRPRVGFDVGEALRLHREGMGVRRIAKRLGVSRSTVHRTIQAVSKASE
jgi:DNA invertase Pin-like site-specific DNA recombinase